MNVLGAALGLFKQILVLLPIIGAYFAGKQSSKLSATKRSLDEAAATAKVRNRIRRGGGAAGKLLDRWSRTPK